MISIAVTYLFNSFDELYLFLFFMALIVRHKIDLCSFFLQLICVVFCPHNLVTSTWIMNFFISFGYLTVFLVLFFVVVHDLYIYLYLFIGTRIDGCVPGCGNSCREY